MDSKSKFSVPEKGPNGFRTGYTAEGDFVECIPDEEESGEEFPMILRRSDQSILDAYNEFRDKVWWNRHQYRMRTRWLNGPLEAEKAIFKRAGEAAARIEAKYKRSELELDELDWGILTGRLSALAWVLGSDWDESSDT